MMLVPPLADIERSAESQAERQVAKLIDDIDMGEGAVAFHSIRLRSHRSKKQSEIDFLLLIDGVVIVLEVKGGGISVEDRIWWTVTRYGERRRLKEPPMKQAQDAGYALQDIFSEDKAGWYAWEAVVVTPDIKEVPRSVEWKASHWLTAASMGVEEFSDSLKRIVDEASGAPRNRKIEPHDGLRRRLFRNFTKLPALSVRSGQVLERQNQATQEQAAVLAAVGANPRVLVRGGAGTGKTLVLCEVAKQEASRRSPGSSDGPKVLVTCLSEGLVPVISEQVAGYGITVVAFRGLETSDRYDVVLVDEAQDLMNSADMDGLDSLLIGGLDSGRWRMVLDPNSQVHVDGVFDEDVYGVVESSAVQLDLPRNVRNTKTIVHLVNDYLAADVGDPGTVEGEKPYWDLDSQGDVEAAADRARELIEEGADRDSIWLVDMSGDAGVMSKNGIGVKEPREVKGLEQQHIVAFGWPDTWDQASVSAVYVSLTRARVSLSILLTRDQVDSIANMLSRRGTA